MDGFQKRVIKAIDKRESTSLRNGLTVLNSYQTGNAFTSVVKIDGQEIATVFYTHDQDDRAFNTHGGRYNPDQSIQDMIKNDKWQIDEIDFNQRAIDRVLGTNAVRYKNLLTRHYLAQGVRINTQFVTV